MTPDETRRALENYLAEMNAVLEAMRDALAGRPVSDFMLSFPPVREAADCRAELSQLSAAQHQLDAIDKAVPRRRESPDVPLVERVVQAVVQMQYDDERCRTWEAEAATARAEVARLSEAQEALRIYGEHRANCTKWVYGKRADNGPTGERWFDNNKPCSCGLARLTAAPLGKLCPKHGGDYVICEHSDCVSERLTAAPEAREMPPTDQPTKDDIVTLADAAGIRPDQIKGEAAPEAQPLPDCCSLCKKPYRGGVTSDDMTCLICWDCITILSYKRDRPAVSASSPETDRKA